MVASVIDAATTNYMQCLGSHADHSGSLIYPVATVNASGPVRTRTSLHGIFGRNSKTGFRDITDGTSNTAMFGEIKKGPNGTGSLAAIPAGDPKDFLVATRDTATWTGNDLLRPPPACENRATTAWLYRGLQYYRGLLVATYYNHTLTPNARFRDCVTSSTYQGHMAARSYHVGGAQVCLADGSVRFVSENIDGGVWSGVGTLSNGEVTGEF